MRSPRLQHDFCPRAVFLSPNDVAIDGVYLLGDFSALFANVPEHKSFESLQCFDLLNRELLLSFSRKRRTSIGLLDPIDLALSFHFLVRSESWTHSCSISEKRFCFCTTSNSSTRHI